MFDVVLVVDVDDEGWISGDALTMKKSFLGEIAFLQKAEKCKTNSWFLLAQTSASSRPKPNKIRKVKNGHKMELEWA